MIEEGIIKAASRKDSGVNKIVLLQLLTEQEASSFHDEFIELLQKYSKLTHPRLKTPEPNATAQHMYFTYFNDEDTGPLFPVPNVVEEVPYTRG
ncbi:hypothetical protein CS022_08045 [Veronia nyctiphanis]|uniref:Uncharacterized protein n=1 Tax=Veronia nyctiphanis TaxID=1278244 RepID=A0A4Q0YRE6_9GAMM|nr:hypothetical protein [Veronia nyctiphanis]RXJ73682.1 hypothetical protein CS022_08045 [Veronia nyctiphanis]